MRLAIVALLAVSLAPAQGTSTAGRQADLDFIANQLPKLHGNFFYQLDPQTYQQAVATLQNRITTTNDAEFYTGLAQIVALAGDMHTSITPQYVFGPGFLPLTLRWLDDGLFVTAAVTQYAALRGSKIVAVNGHPLDQVVQQFGSVFAHANDQWLHAQTANNLLDLFWLHGLDIAAGFSVPITFQTLAGTQVTVLIQQSVDPQFPGLQYVPLYLQRPETYYWFSYLRETRMMYVKYNLCLDNPYGVSVATFAGNILQALDSNPVDTFVTDFRANIGGNEYLLFPLGAGLLQRLEKLRANPKFHIYLAIDKGSFSSGMYTPMAFKSGFMASNVGMAGADFGDTLSVIGEPTGGKPIGFGDVVGFSLPYSGVTGIYGTGLVTQNEGVIPDLPSFNPDIPVSIRSTDYFTGFDPVMAAMLARTTTAPVAPSGEITVVNSASFRVEHGLAPGSFATGFGSFPAAPDQVLVNDVDAHIVSTSATQVNFVIPSDTRTGSARIVAKAGATTVATGQATVTAVGPAIFVLDATNPGQPGAVENQDYNVNGYSHPAAAGEVVSIYATGYGVADSTQVFFDEIPGDVSYSAPLPGIPGLWQINVRVPSGLAGGSCAVALIAGNFASNAVTIQLR